MLGFDLQDIEVLFLSANFMVALVLVCLGWDGLLVHMQKSSVKVCRDIRSIESC